MVVSALSVCHRSLRLAMTAGLERHRRTCSTPTAGAYSCRFRYSTDSVAKDGSASRTQSQRGSSCNAENWSGRWQSRFGRHCSILQLRAIRSQRHVSACASHSRNTRRRRIDSERESRATVMSSPLRSRSMEHAISLSTHSHHISPRESSLPGRRARLPRFRNATRTTERIPSNGIGNGYDSKRR